ncbi:lamin tail domain-containing protein [Phytoactinopolyspora halotolerans]|uniref:Lamin tail domain-containing protein n=1 Tax=Phytoactinopolyspora halotolerans TaxID=1981512 RepID=A0A6L9SBT5_9ACTN|nr:lamin tail domain-containing protein [Phytoactinopolyspora halotolerans]NEE02587.1 lamin tail domain-containing protein [Phytoactinopolyspora halotolerans]
MTSALVVGIGATASTAAEEPTEADPSVVELRDECVYTPVNQHNTNLLRLVLAPGYAYDVTVNGAAVQPDDDVAFDTTEASGDTEFLHSIAVTAPTQSDTVVVSQGGSSLLETVVDSGACEQQPTTLTIQRSASLIDHGDTVALTGELRTTDGSTVAGESVVLERRFVGVTSWTTHGTQSTDGAGRVSFTAKPSKHTQYRLRYEATGRYGGQISDITRVDVRQPTTLSIAVDDGTIKRGQTVTVSGKLTSSSSAVPGRPVSLQYRYPGTTTWKTVTTKDTGSTGRVSFARTPSKHVEYRLRHAQSDAYAGSTSASKTVLVQQPTTLSIARSNSTITAGKSVTISGRLRTGDGVNVSGEKVTFQRRFVGATSWTTVSSKNTSSTGRVSFTAKPSRHTEYRLVHSSNTSYGYSKSPVTRVSVRAALTLTTSRLSGLLGRTTTFKGTVSPYYSKQTVQLQRRVSGTWRTVSTKKPSSSGAYSFSVKPSSTGKYTYRVRVPATDRRYSAASSSKTVVRYAAKITSIHYDAAGNDWHNLNDEYAVVKNTGSVTINLKDWTLDATPQRKSLPSYTLSPGKSVRIHTGSGSQRTGHIYLGYNSPIWNNDGDVGRLYDRYGNRASTYRY